MRKKYLISGLIILILIIAAFYWFDSSKLQYTDFTEAKRTGNKVQVLGSLIKSMPKDYNPSTNIFSFYMKDEKNSIAEINFHGSKPNNFELYPMFVVRGKFINNKFIATEILTKCPSKYEDSLHIN